MNAFKQVKYLGWAIVLIPTILFFTGLWFGLTRDVQETQPGRVKKEAVKIEPKVEKPVAVELKEEPKVEPKVEKPKPVQEVINTEETQDSAEVKIDSTIIIENTINAEIEAAQVG